MPIKSSVLIRTLSDHAIGSIREQLAADVERLEGYGDTIDGFIADNNRDEPPPECERKPLKHYSGHGLFVVIRDSDNAVMATDYRQEDAKQKAVNCGYPCSVVRVMEPTGNECPTERIAPEGCEWGIIKIVDGTIFWCSRHHNFYSSANILNESARFPSKAAAADSIAECGMTDCQPWPIPPKGGAE